MPAKRLGIASGLYNLPLYLRSSLTAAGIDPLLGSFDPTSSGFKDSTPRPVAWLRGLISSSDTTDLIFNRQRFEDASESADKRHYDVPNGIALVRFHEVVVAKNPICYPNPLNSITRSSDIQPDDGFDKKQAYQPYNYEKASCNDSLVLLLPSTGATLWSQHSVNVFVPEWWPENVVTGLPRLPF
ncbi:unnamed protein product [Protopolystoma xenopodis]|uniref:Uncharacterized protein n=1 Tax=Protopolystoma xenopodis TaxID=117903 RepID=A0A3S5B0X3_9PLAT|nr:unnamed protein product [Protopolystoma xenopodis]